MTHAPSAQPMRQRLSNQETKTPPDTHGFVMRVHGGPHDGKLVRIVRDQCTVGRSPECTLRLVGADFEPLHCLIVRGREGVVVRRWSAATLNGCDFSVSWMTPGDRLGIGPIELELLGASDSQAAAPRPTSPPPLVTAENVAQADRLRGESRRQSRRRVQGLCRELRKVRTKLTDAHDLLEQLLGERQELLARLSSLQEEAESRASQPGAADSGREAQLESLLAEVTAERDRATAERDAIRAIVDELRDEIQGIAQLRQTWRAERERLEAELHAARRQAAGSGQAQESAPAPEASSSDFRQAEAEETSRIEPDNADEWSVLARLGISWHPEEQRDGVGQQVDDRSPPSVVCETGSESAAVPADTVSDERWSGANDDGPLTEEEAECLLRRRSASPSINLSAMRDVANLSARVAIDRHAHRHGMQEAMQKWLMGLCAMIMGSLLTMMLQADVILGHVLAAGCWIIAIWWFLLGALSYRRAVHVHPQRASGGKPRPAPAASGAASAVEVADNGVATGDGPA